MNAKAVLLMLGLTATSGATVLAGCSYQQLTPAGQNIVTTTNQPGGQCKSLGNVTGKGGGGGGGYVANEKLVEYAMNDLRNKAADMGATHVQTQPPSLGVGGGQNTTTTSATIVGEAFQCVEGTEGAAVASSGGDTGEQAPSAPAGCQYDTQCKGDRICQDGACVAATPATAADTAADSSTADTATDSSAADSSAPKPDAEGT